MKARIETRAHPARRGPAVPPEARARLAVRRRVHRAAPAARARREPTLRSGYPGTIDALARLRDAGLLDDDDADVLEAAYRFCERARNARYLQTAQPVGRAADERSEIEKLALPARLRAPARVVAPRRLPPGDPPARRVVERDFYGTRLRAAQARANAPTATSAAPITAHTASPVMKDPWIHPTPWPIHTAPTARHSTPITTRIHLVASIACRTVDAVAARARYFRSQAEFRTWLREHHASADEVLVGFHKTATGKPSMTWAQSVDEALCFGWIDGVRKSVDDDRYTIRFTPRRARSIWSQKNISTVPRARCRRPGATPPGRRRSTSATRTGPVSIRSSRTMRS